MNPTQKRLLALYFPLTIVILLLDNLYPAFTAVYHLKYGTIISLFLTAALIHKNYREQYVMAVAVFFAAVADFFLVFSQTIPALAGRMTLYGMSGFLIAYILLITAFQKNFTLSGRNLLVIIPVLAVFLPVLLLLYPHINGLMFIFTIVFALVLCYMSWTALTTIYRGYFSPKAARFIALAGFLMLVCDMGVALNEFHPTYAGQFVPWLKNIIWGAYIPGWTLLVAAIGEEELLAE